MKADYTMNQSELEPRKGQKRLLSKSRVLHLIGLQDSRRFFAKNRSIKEKTLDEKSVLFSVIGHVAWSGTEFRVSFDHFVHCF